MKEEDYPALYADAGAMSQASQRLYLSLLIAEYSTLFFATILALDFADFPLLDFTNNRNFHVLNAIFFLIPVCLMLYRTMQKPEQVWYKGRALAESIKTSTWRYCMRAAPFDDEPYSTAVRSEFRNHLKAVLEANRHIGDRIPPDTAANDQITRRMNEIRVLSLKERKNFYHEHRIKEQRLWYSRKASFNRKTSRYWSIVLVALYIICIISIIFRISYPEWKLWPVGPLVLIASSIIGWMQIKKYNELASAYTLTAHEIGITQTKIEEIHNDNDFSDFVNEAELAFSREHTQWVARQQTQ